MCLCGVYVCINPTTNYNAPNVSMSNMLESLPTWSCPIDVCDLDFAWSVTKQPLDNV